VRQKQKQAERGTEREEEQAQNESDEYEDAYFDYCSTGVVCYVDSYDRHKSYTYHT